MTEKRGGSDVGQGTETIAVRDNEGGFRLHGYKWFSSATDSDMTLTLARVVDQDGKVGKNNHQKIYRFLINEVFFLVVGSGGVSMFFLKTRNPNTGALNGIEVTKLKNKLGTRQLPTAGCIFFTKIFF